MHLDAFAFIFFQTAILFFLSEMVRKIIFVMPFFYVRKRLCKRKLAVPERLAAS
jgi:hypothetical protein